MIGGGFVSVDVRSLGLSGLNHGSSLSCEHMTLFILSDTLSTLEKRKQKEHYKKYLCGLWQYNTRSFIRKECLRMQHSVAQKAKKAQ